MVAINRAELLLTSNMLVIYKMNMSNINHTFNLFQNGLHFSILLFTCKLALVASFLNSKFKRKFSLKRGNKG